MTDHHPPRHYLRDGVLATVDLLHSRGIELPFELKRRDVREPGRKKKEEFEDKFYSLVWRQFRKQRQLIKDRLDAMHPGRKNIPELGLFDSDFDDPDFFGQLYRVLIDASTHGIDLFAATNPVAMDYTLVNSGAADWARNHVGDMIKNVNQTTIDAVRKSIAAFVETPGLTIGDLIRELPFSEHRALLIATSEITQTYANANRLAGDKLKEEFPGVKVIDEWFTNQDSRVCFLCGPMDGMTTELGEPFVHPETGAQFQGPGDPHPGCRCWDAVTTQVT